jgi:uncharacterized cupredoxin-like copper-binding protein
MKKIIIIFTFLFLNSLAYADKNMKIGSKGNETDITRVIKVVMYDNYYEPSSFQIKKGETVKFEVENAGMLVHEFNIANKMMHMKHQPEMVKMAENGILLAFSIDKEKMKKMAKMDKSMGHSHSNSVLLEPKQKGDIIWKFDNAVNIEVACNVPGHYQAGMIAKVNIK